MTVVPSGVKGLSLACTSAIANNQSSCYFEVLFYVILPPALNLTKHRLPAE